MQAPTRDSQSPKEAKLGLALSGGGFRASFFHLGVLAQLANRGLLRQVEALSTVSGGSIIGALYYLQVKKLLEEKVDQEITDQDYMDLVATMEQDFLLAVQRNLRMLTFTDFSKNLKMFRADYSRSDRIGELYDELLYRPVMAPGSSQMLHAGP
jgi:NTE family protein